MKKVKELFKRIEDISKVPFKVVSQEGEVYTSSELSIKSTFAEISIEVFRNELTIIVNSKDKSVLPLLGRFITSAIREESQKESSIIKRIIEKNDYSKTVVEKLYPFLCEDFTVIIVNMHNSIRESLNMIKDGYGDENVCISEYNNNILILGDLDEPREHAESLKETIEYNTKEKCIVGYFKVKGYKNLSSVVKNNIEKINVARKYNIESEVINENSLLFEQIVDSINKETADKLIENYEEGFNKFDEEMIKSIEVFFKCGLNVSESAKLLYIHRNTLIYRMEKVQKCTGFDIKNFNEAIVFKVLYCLWKEKKK